MSKLRDNIDTVLTEKMLQFKLPSAHSVRIAAGVTEGFTQFRPRRACYIRKQKDDRLQNSPRASFPCWEGGDRCEEPTSQLHTCWEGKVIEEI